MYQISDKQLIKQLLFRQLLTRFSQCDWFLDVLKIRADAQQPNVTFTGIV